MGGGKQGVAHLDARAYTPMDMSWRDQAACLGSDTNAFFHSEGTRAVARRGDRAHALHALTRARTVGQVHEDQAWEIFFRAEGTAARSASRWLIDGDHDRAMSWARAAEYLRRQVLLALLGPSPWGGEDAKHGGPGQGAFAQHLGEREVR